MKKIPIYLILSFALPMCILGAIFAWHHVHPFGDRQIIVTDFWQQYYPILSDLWHKLRGGEPLLWSWTNGLGTNYLALLAYYAASPLNLLTLLFPHGYLRDVLTALLVVKIGFSGFAFAAFLKGEFGRDDLSLPLFSMFYALCAFVMGYFWNIMWFDTFALLPLVVLGVSRLVREGKTTLYVVTLALSVLFNYYIGLFTCIFVAIMFFTFCFVQKMPLREMLQRLALIATVSILALLMTAFLTLPAYYALQGSSSSANRFPTSPLFYESFFDILGNLVGFTPPTDKEGLPNIYSGVLCVMLSGFFFASKRISLRERLVYGGILVFLLLSCNLNILSYIWHGFHFPNMLPYRFSFLITFVLLVMAYKAYLLIDDELNRKALAAMTLASGLIMLCAAIGRQSTSAVMATACFTLAYLGITALYMLKQMKKETMLQIFLLFAIVELTAFAHIGLSTVRTTEYYTYPSHYDEVQDLLTQREEAPNEFYRTELTKPFTLNDSALYHYRGVSMFSSVANVNTTLFLENMGLSGWDLGNRYYHAETSPLTGMILNMKYMISLDQAQTADGNYLWEPAAASGESNLFRNRYHVPFGFVAKTELLDYTPQVDNCFYSQNDFFTKATGVPGELFTLVNVTEVITDTYDVYTNDLGDFDYQLLDPDALPEETQDLDVYCDMPVDGVLYAYVYTEDGNDIEIRRNGDTLRELPNKRPYILCCGSYEAGDAATLSIPVDPGRGSGYLKILFAYLNEDVLDAGYAALTEQGGFQATKVEGGRVEGDIHMDEPGLLYFSIPYEWGWTASVDGVQRDPFLIDHAMLALYLEEGEHHIELRYMPYGFLPGVACSAAALLFYVGFVLLSRRRANTNLS